MEERKNGIARASHWIISRFVVELPVLGVETL